MASSYQRGVATHGGKQSGIIIGVAQRGAARNGVIIEGIVSNENGAKWRERNRRSNGVGMALEGKA